MQTREEIPEICQTEYPNAMADIILQEPWARVVENASFSDGWYGDLRAAAEVLESALWQNGAECFKCGSSDCRELGQEARRAWICGNCRFQFSVRHGTWLHRGRMPLDRVLLALVSYEKLGAVGAVERLVEVSKMRPELADKLVQTIEKQCYGEAVAAVELEPEVEPAIELEGEKPRRFAKMPVWVGIAASVAVLGIGARGVLGPSGLTHAAGFAPTQGSLTDRLTYTLGGRAVEATITTPRAGFSSTKDWYEAHALKVRAANALAKIDYDQ